MDAPIPFEPDTPGGKIGGKPGGQGAVERNSLDETPDDARLGRGRFGRGSGGKSQRRRDQNEEDDADQNASHGGNSAGLRQAALTVPTPENERRRRKKQARQWPRAARFRAEFVSTARTTT